MILSKLCEMVKDREAGHAAVHGVAKNWTRLSTEQHNALLYILKRIKELIMFSPKGTGNQVSYQ